jgi:hypothetical protein
MFGSFARDRGDFAELLGVYDLVGKVPASLLTMAQGVKAYSKTFDLVHRRKRRSRTPSGKPITHNSTSCCSRMMAPAEMSAKPICSCDALRAGPPSSTSMPGGRVLVDFSRLHYRLRVPANVPAKGQRLWPWVGDVLFASFRM